MDYYLESTSTHRMRPVFPLEYYRPKWSPNALHIRPQNGSYLGGAQRGRGVCGGVETLSIVIYILTRAWNPPNWGVVWGLDILI